jgi:hypothetical protein
MAQRLSGYVRTPDENYPTVEDWPVRALLFVAPCIEGWAWDPADPGDGSLVTALHRQHVKAVGTGHDFLTMTDPPMADTTDIVCNPPYGAERRGELAIAFIRHALTLPIRRISMLLPIDFDSAITRQDVFRFCPAFTGKLTLLGRIQWIPGSTGSPSTNHCWFTWDKSNVDAPVIRYVSRREVER